MIDSLKFLSALLAVGFLFSDIRISAQPSNDICANAIELIPNTGGFFSDNFGTIDDGPAPSCGDPVIKDVWFKWVHTGEQTTINSQPVSLPGMRITVYDSCGGTELVCESGFGSVSLDLNCFDFNLGETYFIQVGSFFDQQGTFNIQIFTDIPNPGCTDSFACNYFPAANCEDGTCIYTDACGVCGGTGTVAGCTDESAFNYNPAADCDDNITCIYSNGSDNCFNAPELIPNEGPIAVDNTISAFNGTTPSCGGSGQIQDVWFQFTYTGGVVFIGTLEGTLNTCISVYDACDGTELFCSDNNGLEQYSAALSLDCSFLNYEETYFVQCGGVNGTVGSFELEFEKIGDLFCPSPINDQCLNALDLFPNMPPVSTSNEFSVANPFGASCANIGLASNDVWFKFTHFGGQITITTIPGTLNDTVLALWDDCPNSGGQEIACNDDSGFGLNSQLVFDCDELVFLQTYYIQASSFFSFDSGTFQIQLESSGTPGCTDPSSCNFDPLATCDDGSCTGLFGCTNPLACNFNDSASCDDGTCTLPGCTYDIACNFDPAAGCEDGSCTFPGCTDPTAVNFESFAACDDGSCQYPGGDCVGDLNNDQEINTSDLLAFLSVFGGTCD